jgi:hypothetical protein
VIVGVGDRAFMNSKILWSAKDGQGRWRQRVGGGDEIVIQF